MRIAGEASSKVNVAFTNFRPLGTSELGDYTVNTSIGQMTRVATDDDGSQHFEAKDAISVYAWTGKATEIGKLLVDNSINTYDGAKWTASPQMQWADQESDHYFIGIHPARPTGETIDLVADRYTLDVTQPEKNDLLVATNLEGWNILTAPGGVINLEFDHVMAKLVVNLKFRTQWGGIPTVESVKAQDAVTTATVDYLHKTVTADATPSTTLTLKKLETPPTGYALSYAFILLPQPDFRTITIRIDGKDYTYSGDIKLLGGRYTTVNLTVGRDRIELDDVTVNDWQQGEVIDGGKAVD